MIKARKLLPGDRVAAITLSWGGPGAFPHRYAVGKSQLEEEFGLEVVETRHALRDPEWLYRNPQARAEDLMEAFEDPTVSGIFSTIGGDDSIRLETSEEAPPPTTLLRTLRVYAAMGILQRLSGILFAKPGGDVPVGRFDEYDEAILRVVVGEQGLTDLPIVTRMDFGHTDPMFVLPYGVEAEIDCEGERFSIVEGALVD